MANAQPPPSADAARALLEQIEQTATLVGMTEALVASRRPVELAGLERQVGLLCARALDLPPELVPMVRHEMVRLDGRLESLHATLRDAAG